MFCKKCGTQNVLDSKFCVACGAPLEEINQNNEIKQTNAQGEIPKSTGGIRKALKEKAKANTKSFFVGATTIYLLLSLLIGIIIGLVVDTDDMPFWATIVEQIMTSFISVILSYGIIATALDMLRGKEVNFNSVLSKPFKNINKVIVIFAIICIINLVFSLLTMITETAISGVLSLVLVVFMIYFIPVIYTMICLYADENEKDLTFNQAFIKANQLTKGRRVEYYGLMCSFIGWCLLALLTLGILYIWILPYMLIAGTYMYLRWRKEEVIEESKSGLSNGAVIGLSAGGGCGCLIVFVIIVVAIFSLVYAVDEGSFTDLLEKIGTDSISEKILVTTGKKGEVTITVGDENITFTVPSKFSTKGNYNTSTYASFKDDDYNSITYQNTFTSADEAYEEANKSLTDYRYTSYTYEDNEFTTNINENSVKCHIVKETTSYETVSYEAFAIYPVNDESSIKISLKTDDPITESTIKKYVKVK